MRNFPILETTKNKGSTMATEQKYTFPATLRDKFPGMDDETLQNIWNATLDAHKAQKGDASALRKAAKEAAEEKAKNKRQDLLDLCEEAGIPVPKLAKSLHRTDKKVDGKVPQVLCGVKFRAQGISGSKDYYVPTGKGAKLTPKVEQAVKDAQILALRGLLAMEEAGFEVGDDEEENTEA